MLEHLTQVDGVMLGRLACDNPYHIAEIHHALYPEHALLPRSILVQKYIEYLTKEHAQGVALSILLKPIFNLAHGLPGAKQWKQMLMAVLQSKDLALLDDLLQYSWHLH